MRLQRYSSRVSGCGDSDYLDFGHFHYYRFSTRFVDLSNTANSLSLSLSFTITHLLLDRFAITCRIRKSQSRVAKNGTKAIRAIKFLKRTEAASWRDLDHRAESVRSYSPPSTLNFPGHDDPSSTSLALSPRLAPLEQRGITGKLRRTGNDARNAKDNGHRAPIVFPAEEKCRTLPVTMVITLTVVEGRPVAA